jgi:c-di-AMP phosphodiesterase-like protein
VGFFIIYDIYSKRNIMKKIIRLTEDDLTRIVEKVISEQTSGINTDKGFNSNLFKDKTNDKGFNSSPINKTNNGKQPKMVKDPITGESQKVIDINTLGHDLKFDVNKNIKFYYDDVTKSFEVVDMDNNIRYQGNLK